MSHKKKFILNCWRRTATEKRKLSDDQLGREKHGLKNFKQRKKDQFILQYVTQGCDVGNEDSSLGTS